MTYSRCGGFPPSQVRYPAVLINISMVLFMMILFLLSPTSASSVVIKSFPTKWDLPTPLELVITLPVAYPHLRIDVVHSGGLVKFSTLSPLQCHVALTSDTDFIPITFVVESNQLVISGRLVPDNTPVVASQIITLYCPSISIKRPEGTPHGSDGLEPAPITVQVSFLDSIPVQYSVVQPINRTINDTPTLLHQYRLDENGLVDITFTFYRPPSMSTYEEFFFEHPLLDVNSITRLHLSPDADPIDELGRLYHLHRFTHPDQLIECLSLTGKHAELKYIATYGPKWIQALTLPSNTPSNKEFICSFHIQYPPSFLEYLQHITSTTEGQLSVKMTYAGGSNSLIPLEIPLGFDTTAFASHDQPPFYVSHYHHYPPMTTNEFELAIITPSRRFFNTASLPEILNASLFFKMTDLESLISSNHNTLVTDLIDWPAQIACRSHTMPMYPQYKEIQNGNIPISIHDFGGYGKVCHIKFQGRPESFPSSGSLQINSYHNFTGSFDFHHIAPISFYDTKLVPESNAIDVYETSMIKTAQLPNLPPKINFIKEWNTNGSTSSVAVMHFQPLVETKSLPGLMARMYIHLVFVDEISMSDILPQPPQIHVDISIDMGNREMMSFRPDNSPHNDSANVNFGTFLDNHTSLIDPLSTIFQPNKRVHSPKFQIPIPLLAMGPSRPGKITLRIPTLRGYDMTSTSIYAYATVYSIAPHFPYIPQLARLTRVRTTPLTGYSYRCVTWDRMAAPYVYGTQGTQPITDSNSTPCGEYVPSIQAAESTNVSDDSEWKRVEYLTSCFYELAAVCVTPSATVEGEYVAHPLADCPSFLGETHALPCSLVDHENEQTWGYSLSNFGAQIPESVHPVNDPLINLSEGVYEGDPRLELTVSLRLSRSASVEDIHLPTDYLWVDVDRTLPAVLFQKRPQGSIVPSAAIRVPLLDHTATSMDVRIQLNGHPSVVAYVKIMNPIKEEMVTGCSPDANKEFDLTTGLCRCVSGWSSTVPIGIDHPFVKPDAFECILCDDGYSLNAKTKQCEPDLPDTTICHTIPPHVVPPFQTNACGFGVPHGENCNQCTCLSRWIPHSDDNDSTRCSECRLEYGTDEERCIADHTDDISYTPEYCWVGRCLCKPGFYGDKCEHKVMYGTLEYTKPVEDVEPYVITATTSTTTTTTTTTSENEEVTILRRRQLLAVQDRIVGEIKAAIGNTATDVHMFLQQATQRRVPRSDNIDDGYDVITTIVIGMQPPVDTGNDGDGEDGSEGDGNHPDGSPFIHLANSDDFSSLYDAWQDLQNSGANIPVDPDFGQVGGIQPPYDPHCVPNGFTSCPEGVNNLLPPTSQVDPDELDKVYKEEEEDPDNPIIDISDDDDDNSKSSSNTTTYIIIGVVVGVVLLLFVALIVAIVYCRKHDKMCFRKRRGKGGASGDSRSVELASSSNNSKSNTNTPTSAPPPSSTMSTSSYLPTQVTIADPTLPADWIALEDKSTGKIYYSNKITMESSWDHPAQPKEKEEAVNAYGW